MPSDTKPGETPRTELTLVLNPDVAAEPEEAERLARQLRAELPELVIDAITPVTGERAPEGSKGIETFAWGAWFITLTGSGGALTTLIGTIGDWLGRHTGGPSVSVVIDGDKLELSRATAEEKSELISAFIRRHTED